jgi:predicted nucleic acid-binding protein
MRLESALANGEPVFSTGIILQELLQGFAGPRAALQIVQHFAAIPLIAATRDDHIKAAELRNACRRRGIQVGTIDALLARLCIRCELVMLSTDRDFVHIAESTSLRLS